MKVRERVERLTGQASRGKGEGEIVTKNLSYQCEKEANSGVLLKKFQETCGLLEKERAFEPGIKGQREPVEKKTRSGGTG